MGNYEVLNDGPVCDLARKISYAKDDALRAMRALLALDRDLKNTQKLNIYKCSACCRWHVGHSKGNRGLYV